MLSEKERQWVAEKGSPEAQAFVQRYDKRKPTGFFRSLGVLLLLVAGFAVIPLAILMQGRFRMLHRLAGTWQGELRSEKPEDPQPPVDPVWSDSTKSAEKARWEAQRQAYVTGAQRVFLNVHRDLWHLSAPSLKGTITLCDQQGHRVEHAFSTTTLGDDFFRFTIPGAGDGAPGRNVSAMLEEGALHLALPGEHSTLQGDLQHGTAMTFHAICGAVAPPQAGTK